MHVQKQFNKFYSLKLQKLYIENINNHEKINRNKITFFNVENNCPNTHPLFEY